MAKVKRKENNNGQKKKDKGINTSLQNTTQKKQRSSNMKPTKYWV